MKKADNLDINSKQLRLFLSIYDTGSLTLTAQMLGMNQSTVSYWLDRLRHKFNDSLFIRSGHGVVATDRAESLVPQARDLLHAINAFSQGDTYHPENDDGVLKIAANALERDLILQPLMAEARKVAPDLSFEIYATGSGYQVAESLRNGALDLAILPTSIIDADGIRQRVLYPIQMSVFYDPKAGEAPTDLESYCKRPHGLISLGPDSKSIVDGILAKLGVRRNVILQVADFDTLALLIKGTSTLVTLPDLFQYSCLRDFAIAPVPWDAPEESLAILWHSRQQDALRNQYWRRLAIELKPKLS